MARRIKASKIQDAIRKAQRVGEVEERFTLDGCDLVLRSLEPGEYQEVLGEIDELEDVAYMVGYRVGHLCRSIIEINGESLRDVDLVEVDIEEDVDGEKKIRTIALERHKFVADYLLASWSREAIDSAFRKFGDVVEKAEQRAIEGVEFRVPDETPEDKFRRLLGEAKELEGQIPFELVGRILNEIGYMSKSSKEELETVDKRLARVASEIGSTGSVASPQGVVEQPTDSDSSGSPAPSRSARVPLNQRAVSVPNPSPPVVTSAKTSEDPRPRPLVQLSPEVLRRSRELEALESSGPISMVSSEVDRSTSLGAPAIQSSTRVAEAVPTGTVVAASASTRSDPSGIGSILDRPPTVGVNPRYRPPPRG
jgi:hypothetical protein